MEVVNGVYGIKFTEEEKKILRGAWDILDNIIHQLNGHACEKIYNFFGSEFDRVDIIKIMNDLDDVAKCSIMR